MGGVIFLAGQELGQILRFGVLRFDFEIFDHLHASVHELLFWQQRREYGLAVVIVHSVQVLSLHLLLGHDVNAVKHSQLRDVEKNLDAIVLLVLDLVEAHVKLRQRLEVLNVPELKNFLDSV